MKLPRPLVLGSLLIFHTISVLGLSTVSTRPLRNGMKKWNFIVYIAGNNNLHRFALLNLKQMFHVGSTEHINVLVQLDQWGKQITTRYFIAKNQPQIVESYTTTIHNASGTPQSLFDCIEWAIKTYPAENQALILWNHGAGIIDPHIWGRLMPDQRNNLYVFNPKTCLLELDKSLLSLKGKGIGFNEAFETYLSNQELTAILSDVSKKLLGGKKINIVGMDACHMSMVEVASQIKDSVDFMLGSQEIEPGPGWNYEYILEPFKQASLTPYEFAQHIVNSYEREYKNSINDYTQSAINLEHVHELEENTSAIALCLVQLLNNQGYESILQILQKIRKSTTYTTSFYNFNYIDLVHFYKSILQNIGLHAPASAHLIIKELETLLEKGIDLVQKICFANTKGPAFKEANGLSIYFPIRAIHDSYTKTIFAQTTLWLNFLITYAEKAGRIKPGSSNALIESDHEESLEDYFPLEDGETFFREKGDKT